MQTPRTCATPSFSPAAERSNSSRLRRGFAVAFGAWLVAFSLPSEAKADLIGPDEEACQNKNAGDACALPSGGTGSCLARIDGRGRHQMACGATVLATPSSTPTASPSASSAPAPLPTSSAPSKGCAVAPGEKSSGLGALLFLGVALASRARRRPRLGCAVSSGSSSLGCRAAPDRW